VRQPAVGYFVESLDPGGGLEWIMDRSFFDFIKGLIEERELWDYLEQTGRRPSTNGSLLMRGRELSSQAVSSALK
jgi:hypothetical protein